jgi:hypothetical protein
LKRPALKFRAGLFFILVCEDINEGWEDKTRAGEDTTFVCEDTSECWEDKTRAEEKKTNCLI